MFVDPQRAASRVRGPTVRAKERWCGETFATPGEVHSLSLRGASEGQRQSSLSFVQKRCATKPRRVRSQSLRPVELENELRSDFANLAQFVCAPADQMGLPKVF